MPTTNTLRRAALFVLIGLILYVGAYGASESLVRRYALRNRFAAVGAAGADPYGYVILGASHALPLDFQDTNALLEQATGARIVNLAMPGAGIVPNRLLLDYFLVRHRTRAVLYVLDSFAFYARDWNEDRLRDVRLLQRAPLDADLARLLLSYAVRGLVPPGVALDYLAGFSKINNADRFQPDVLDMETRFTRVARPSKLNARDRIAYLYPRGTDAAAADRYLAMFSDLIETLRARGVAVIVVKLPVPDYYAALLPAEAETTRRLAGVLAGRAAFYDLSGVGNDERFFLDTDHLNRDGVRNLLDTRLREILLQHHP